MVTKISLTLPIHSLRPAVSIVCLVPGYLMRHPFQKEHFNWTDGADEPRLLPMFRYEKDAER